MGNAQAQKYHSGTTSRTALGIFFGIGHNKRIPVIAAGGMPNHVHLAIDLPPVMKVGDAISAFKANSSRWLKQEGVRGFAWQTGYGAFSFGIPQVEQVKILINGKERETLAGHADIKSTYSTAAIHKVVAQLQ